MSSQLSALCFDALDPPSLARFWASVLSWEIAGDRPDGSLIEPTDDTGFPIRFRPTREQKTGPNQMHFHLTSMSLEDQRQTVARAIGLGARPLDVGQRPEEGHVVLADPEGNEFCVIEPGNKFLAGCGFLAELACDGSAEVGYFWSAALGWRWSGIRTRRRRFARRTAVRRSAGVARPRPRRPGRTGCTSTLCRRLAVIRPRRLAA